MNASTLATAAAVFTSTNIDDIVLLSVLFSDTRMKPSAIVLGQYLGIGALVLLSAVAGIASVAIPRGWLSLLGLLPLLLGVYKLVILVRSHKADDDESPDIVMNGNASLLSSALAVAGVTIANGGDNVSVYIPLFATDRALIPLYVGLFALLTGIWCWLGYQLIANRIFGQKIQKYGHIALPIVLMGLGVQILLFR